MKQMRVKNKFLMNNQMLGMLSLPNWLARQMLHGDLSRARSKFIRMTAPFAEQANERRKEIMERHADHDKDGKTLYLDREGKETTKEEDGISFKIKDDAAFKAEVDAFTNDAPLVIDNDKQNTDVVMGIRKILLETDEKFSGALAVSYDEWCEMVEDMPEKEKEAAKE